MVKSTKTVNSAAKSKSSAIRPINQQPQTLPLKEALASLNLRPFNVNHRQAVEYASIGALKALMVSQAFAGQRAHEERAPRATELHGELMGPKLDFAAIRFRDPKTRTLKVQLVDGYTRLTCLAMGLSWVAEGANIILSINDCADDEQMHKVYSGYNALGAAKRGNDHIKSGLRLALNDTSPFRSSFMQKAQLVSAMSAYAPQRWKIESEKSRVVAECVPAMLFLDKLQLRVNPNRSCGPLLTVMLLAAQYTQGDLRAYVAQYAKAMLEACFTQMPNASVSDIALKACYDNWTLFLLEQTRKPTGGEAVKHALALLMGDFARYFNACLVEMGKRRSQVNITGNIQEVLAEIKEVSDKLAA